MRSSVRCWLRFVIGVTVWVAVAGCSNSAAGTAAVVTGAISPASSSVASSSPPPMVMTVTATVIATAPAPPPSTSLLASAQPPTTQTTTGPVIPPTDLTGEVYGFVTAVDVPNSQITLDKIDWFTGAAAQQACAEDGVTRTDNNWCSGYYYRNVNPQLRVVAMSPTASIRTLADGTHSADSNLPAVADRVAETAASNTYRLLVNDGLVTSLEEMYHP